MTEAALRGITLNAAIAIREVFIVSRTALTVLLIVAGVVIIALIGMMTMNGGMMGGMMGGSGGMLMCPM